jgi:hypothetical protein
MMFPYRESSVILTNIEREGVAVATRVFDRPSIPGKRLSTRSIFPGGPDESQLNRTTGGD